MTDYRRERQSYESRAGGDDRGRPRLRWEDDPIHCSSAQRRIVIVDPVTSLRFPSSKINRLASDKGFNIGLHAGPM